MSPIEELVELLARQDKGVKSKATLVAATVDDLMCREVTPTLNKAFQAIHLVVQGEMGYRMARGTIRKYYRTVVWLGSNKWLTDRTYTHHEQAMTMNWTYERLVLEVPPIRTSGLKSEKPETALLRALGLTESSIERMRTDAVHAKGTQATVRNMIIDIVDPFLENKTLIAALIHGDA